MKALKLCLASFAITLLIASCGKDPLPANNNNGSTGTPNGTMAPFSVIKLPMVDLANLIIPNLAQFYVTNQGPYVQIQNTNKQLWSFHKYVGGTGTSAWISYSPSYAVSYFRPTSMFYEANKNIFSIYWCNTNLTDDKYGMYNMNTGTPAFERLVPGGANGPYVLSEIIPTTKASGLAKPWGLLGNDIYVESTTVSPTKFDKVVSLPSTAQRIRTDAIMADPDEETTLWVSAAQRLYQVSQVGNPAPPTGTIKSSWNFSSVSATDRFQAIIKVNGSIVVQFGPRVYRQSGTSFSLIGTLNTSPGTVAQICTDGSTIYASDGTYYDSNSNTWKSFIGTGQNLSAADAAKYQQLKTYTQSGLPIGCGYRSGTVYFLSPTELIAVTPLR